MWFSAKNFEPSGNVPKTQDENTSLSEIALEGREDVSCWILRIRYVTGPERAGLLDGHISIWPPRGERRRYPSTNWT